MQTLCGVESATTVTPYPRPGTRHVRADGVFTPIFASKAWPPGHATISHDGLQTQVDLDGSGAVAM